MMSAAISFLRVKYNKPVFDLSFFTKDQSKPIQYGLQLLETDQNLNFSNHIFAKIINIT